MNISAPAPGNRFSTILAASGQASSFRNESGVFLVRTCRSLYSSGSGKHAERRERSGISRVNPGPFRDSLRRNTGSGNDEGRDEMKRAKKEIFPADNRGTRVFSRFFPTSTGRKTLHIRPVFSGTLIRPSAGRPCALPPRGPAYRGRAPGFSGKPAPPSGASGIFPSARPG